MSKYFIPENLAVSDSGFLFLSSTGETFTLNGIGRDIFKMLQNGQTDKEVIDSLLEDYDIDRVTLEKDYSDFINQLKIYAVIKTS
jgi:hypothetical protein